MKLLLISISLLFTTTALADCCICTTDTSPRNHIKWYKTGCRMWLTARGCPLGKIISHDEDIEKHIPKSCEGKKLKLGYVGHWASSRDTVDYLTSIMGVLNKKNLSLQYDNTACLAMSNPNEVQSYLNDISPHLGKRKIVVKGNQAISTGMWDPILPGKHNFKAVASTEAERVMFPKCRKLVNKSCWGRFQEGETGICIEKDGTKSILKCSKKKRSKLNVFKFLLPKRSRKMKTVWQKIKISNDDFKVVGNGKREVFNILPAQGKDGKSFTFNSEDWRDDFLKRIQDGVKTVTDQSYKDLEIKTDTEEIIHHEIKDGKYTKIKTGETLYSTKFQDPITGETIRNSFDTKETYDNYIREIRSTKSKDEIAKYSNLEPSKTTEKMIVRIRNPNIDFSKNFQTLEEAEKYILKIKSYSKKELNDFVFNDFLSKK